MNLFNALVAPVLDETWGAFPAPSVARVPPPNEPKKKDKGKRCGHRSSPSPEPQLAEEKQLCKAMRAQRWAVVEREEWERLAIKATKVGVVGSTFEPGATFDDWVPTGGSDPEGATDA